MAINRIVIHCGFHKTASTYLQGVCSLYNNKLMEHGVYFHKSNNKYPSHNWVAHSMLSGNSNEMECILDKAPDATETILISAEDFENCVASESAYRQVDDVISSLGIKNIEYAIVTRRTEEYFLSIYSEMSKHGVYLDLFSMFDEVMRTGKFSVRKDPDDKKGVPGGWDFIFDCERYITSFRERVSRPVHVFQYENKIPFPGWQVIELAAQQKIDFIFPDNVNHEELLKYRNDRLSDLDVSDRYKMNIMKHFSNLIEKGGIMDTELEILNINSKYIKNIRDALQNNFK